MIPFNVASARLDVVSKPVLAPFRPRLDRCSGLAPQDLRSRLVSLAGKEPGPTDSTEWSLSMPSYMQSTVQTDVCDEWSDAINEAEAEAAVRESALREGRDPEVAVQLMREEKRAHRTEIVWREIRREATQDIDQEPMLSSFLYASILSHKTFHEALSFVLSNRLADQTMLPTQLFALFESLFNSNPDIIRGAIADLQAVYDRDPACISYSCALLYFKGYQAIQIHRLSHELWLQGRRVMALSLQSRMSEVLGLDIHPAATFGRGILLDHGTGVVIGETAVIGNGVSIMQNVTLGGTGKEVGDRHPKIQDNVLIGAGAAVLGNIVVGTGAQVVAGSLVLKPVEAHTMVAGSPAKCVGMVRGNPALQMEQWSKLVFENGRAEQQSSGKPYNVMGHTSAEHFIFGTGSKPGGAATTSGDGKQGGGSSAASASPAADVRKSEEARHAPADGKHHVADGGAEVSLPEARQRAESMLVNRGVLESISAAEHSGRSARIEKKRDWLKNATSGKPGALRPVSPPSNGVSPYQASSNGAAPPQPPRRPREQHHSQQARPSVAPPSQVPPQTREPVAARPPGEAKPKPPPAPVPEPIFYEI